MIEKKWWKVSEIVKTGLPRGYVLAACRGEYGSRFARKTSENGNWIINRKKFEEMIEAGYFG